MRNKTFALLLATSFVATNIALASTNYSFETQQVQPIQNINYQHYLAMVYLHIAKVFVDN